MTNWQPALRVRVRRSRITNCLILLCGACFAQQVHAQRAGENAVATADDAFGSSIGNDSIGLYSTSDIRGFSALDAGNARIDGLYFDQKSSVTGRIRAGSDLRVGLNAQSFAFPAPTGVIDYRLRQAGERRIVSTVLGLDANLSPYLEIDTLTPLQGERLGIAAGMGFQRNRRIDSSDADYVSYGTSLHWMPADNLRLRAFYGRFDSFNDEAQASIFASGNNLPPEIERMRFYGLDWADGRGYVQNAGITTQWQASPALRVEAGLFSSIGSQQRISALLFNATTPEGLADRTLVSRRDQHTHSVSGELKLSRLFTEGPRQHLLRLSLRGRDVAARYGGAAIVPLGQARIGIREDIPEQTLNFSPLSHDGIAQHGIGLAYEVRWRDLGEISVGLMQNDYGKSVNIPGRPRAAGTDKPLLLNASGAWYASDNIVLYGSFTEGLEESGIAPDNAGNRGEVLPALRTRQVDAGVRVALSPALRLVAGLFDVRKPYFNLDASDTFFRELGEVRHRGTELSLTGQVTTRLSVVAGAVLMQPEVSGPAVVAGTVGNRPLGQTRSRLLMGLNYQVPGVEGLLLDTTLTRVGSRTANLAATLETPALFTVDIGLRKTFRIGAAPAVLRLQLLNVTDRFVWQVNRSGAFQPNQERTLSGSLAVDF